MIELSDYLKKLRADNHLSLKALAKHIGSTDAILSRLENGQLPKDIPYLFNSLAEFYNINVITLYIKSNLISLEALNEYNGIFTNCSNLTEKEIKQIQSLIDFIIDHRNSC